VTLNYTSLSTNAPLFSSDLRSICKQLQLTNK
jgi:hypothetical protein